MNRRHISVILFSTPSIGGGFQYSKIILNALSSQVFSAYEISYILIKEEWRSVISNSGERIKVHSIKIPFWSRVLRKVFCVTYTGTKIWRLIGQYLHPLYALLARLQSDLVISPCGDFLAVGWKGVSVVPIHDLMHRYERRFPEVGNLNSFVKREVSTRIACRLATLLLVDSEVGRKHVLESYRCDGKKIYVLPFPSSFSGAHPPKRKVRTILPPDLPKRFFFYPAQLWPHKNHVQLIEAIASLNKKQVSVNLILVGARKDGDEEIFRRIERHKLGPQVKYLGYVDDDVMVALYKSAVALVFPSYFGPTNLPPVEALGLGCPVAVARVYGAEEQLEDSAIYFDPNSINELSDVLLRLWTDTELRGELISKGYRIANKFKPELFAQRFEIAVQSVLTQQIPPCLPVERMR